MAEPELEASILDRPPTERHFTDYDRQHLVTYLRLLDAAAENADPDEVARVVLHIDPGDEPERARRAYQTHLARARWLAQSGYRRLLADPKLK